MRKSSGSCLSLAFLLCCFMVTGASAQESGFRIYQLPEHGSIKLKVPAAWKDEVQQPPQSLPPTIVLRQKTGPSFQIMITPIWPAKKDNPPVSAAKIRQMVQEAVERVKSQAVEKTIEVKDLKGSPGGGCYFSITVRAPKAGEFKYLTQGMMHIGDLLTTFTILANEGQLDIVSETLQMLKSAVRSNPT